MKKISFISTILTNQSFIKGLLLCSLLFVSLSCMAQKWETHKFAEKPVSPNDFGNKTCLLVDCYAKRSLSSGEYGGAGCRYEGSKISLVYIELKRTSSKYKVSKVISEGTRQNPIKNICIEEINNREYFVARKAKNHEFYSYPEGLFWDSIDPDCFMSTKSESGYFVENKVKQTVDIKNHTRQVLVTLPADCISKKRYSENLVIYKDPKTSLWGVFDLITGKTVLNPSFREEELVTAKYYGSTKNIINIRGTEYTLGKDVLPNALQIKQNSYKIESYIDEKKTWAFVTDGNSTSKSLGIYDKVRDSLIVNFEITDTIGYFNSAYGIRNGKDFWGYVDNDLHFVSLKYSLLSVCQEKKWTSEYYRVAYNLKKHGFAIAQDATTLKWGIINSKNTVVLPFVYESIYYQSNGQYKVEKEGKTGLLDDRFNEILPLKYETIIALEHDPSWVKQQYNKVLEQGQWGVISNGKVIVPTLYSDVKILNKQDENTYLIKKNSKWGIFKNGKEVVPTEYDYIEELRNSIYKVKKNGKYGILDDKGLTLSPNYDNVMLLAYKEFSYVVKNNGKFGIAYHDRIILPIEYDDINLYNSEFSYRWSRQFYTYTKSGVKGIFQTGLGSFPNYTTAGESYGWLYVCNDKECKIYDNKADFQTTVGDGYQALKYIESNSYEGRKAISRDDARRESAEREKQEKARKQAKQTEDAVEREKRKSTPCVCSSCNGKGHYVTKTSHTETKYVPTYDKNGASTGSKLVNVEVPDERKVTCSSCKGTGSCAQ